MANGREVGEADNRIMRLFPKLLILSPVSLVLTLSLGVSITSTAYHELELQKQSAAQYELLCKIDAARSALASFWHAQQTEKVFRSILQNQWKAANTAVSEIKIAVSNDREGAAIADKLQWLSAQLEMSVHDIDARAPGARKMYLAKERGCSRLLDILLDRQQTRALALSDNQNNFLVSLFASTLLWLIAVGLMLHFDCKSMSTFRQSLLQLLENLAALLDLRPLTVLESDNEFLSAFDEHIHEIAYRTFLSLREEQAPLGFARDIVCKLDATGGLIRINPSGQHLLSMEENDSPPITRYLSETSATAFTALLAKRVSFTLETELKNVSGDVRWLQWSCVWSTIDSAFFCIARDTTELNRAQKFRSELIKMIVHDVRSPLSALRVFLGVMRDGKYGDLSEKGNTRVESARNDVVRITRLLEDLIDFERIEKHELALSTKEVSLDTAIETAIAGLTPLAEEKEIEVTSSKTQLSVQADPDRLGQILVNLMGNAIKFSARRGTIKVVAAKDSGGLIEIAIADNGQGIEVHHLARIFEPFYQTSSEHKHDGYGLGLAIVRMLVELHGGSIKAASTPGTGTVITFTLPPARPEPPAGVALSLNQGMETMPEHKQ